MRARERRDDRVVPYWIIDFAFDSWRPQPIMHGWMDERDAAVVLTSINSYEWPVLVQRMPTST
ncbi:hypothetical protein EDD18DRAFT_1074144 [Armillaria luteobubalina]|uniref:Uncharacterized protein n=1 Tax=Armillaria luteobubalina TaxID=153913 RepID=A0AA39UTC9_9AGAR|nr:hypothetical protein EDD18DRAFT_1074144 [Armillaria luteobubalina]